MQKLSNYLLNLSRYQNDSLKVDFKELSLDKVIRKAIQKLLPLANAKKINIKIDLAKVRIKGNEASLAELLTILLDNAIKYSSENQEIFIKLTKKHKNALLSVQDLGIGIKASDLPHIFDRFYRTDSSRSRQHTEGFGLGLSIAKSIVALHHGEIKVKSTLSKGSTFSIILAL